MITITCNIASADDQLVEPKEALEDLREELGSGSRPSLTGPGHVEIRDRALGIWVTYRGPKDEMEPLVEVALSSA